MKNFESKNFLLTQKTCLSDPVGKPADDVDCDYGEDKLCNLPFLGQYMAILGGAGSF